MLITILSVCVLATENGSCYFIFQLKLHTSILHQAYFFVKECGPNGITQKQLGKVMGQSRLDARTLCRWVFDSSGWLVVHKSIDKRQQEEVFY